MPKIFEALLVDHHEITGEVVQYTDIYLRSLLDNFEKKGYLEDTVIIFHSDHGHHMNGVLRMTKAKVLDEENYLSSLFIILPQFLRTELGPALKANENVLFSTVDFYQTMVEFGAKDNKRMLKGRGASILHPLKTTRGCEVIAFRKSEIECYCEAP